MGAHHAINKDFISVHSGIFRYILVKCISVIRVTLIIILNLSQANANVSVTLTDSTRQRNSQIQCYLVTGENNRHCTVTER